MWPKSALIFVFGVVLGAIVVRSIYRPHEGSVPDRFSPTAAGLDRMIGQIEIDADFTTAIAQIAKAAGVTITVEPDAPSSDPEGPVRLSLRNVTVATALQEVLRVSKADESVGLRAQDGVIQVALKMNLDRLQVMRLYAVGDLLEAAIKGRLKVPAMTQETQDRITSQTINGPGPSDPPNSEAGDQL